MKVALHSASPRLGDVEANVARVKEALTGDDELVVFPELFLTGYNIGEDVQRLAFTGRDARLVPLMEACEEQGVHLIVGAPHTPRKGITYNAALCIDDVGAVNWVHKRALPNFATFQEALHFARGDTQHPWYTRFGAIGVGICYDLYFPEIQRRQALEDADVLLNISASPSASRRFFESLLPARAIENACFSLYSNNVGAQDGLVFWGGSQAWGPRGELLGRSQAYEEDVLRVRLDLDDVEAARQSRPTLRDAGPGGLGAGDLEALEAD